MPATPAWPPRSAPRLFVDPPLSAGAQIVLDGPQAHYLVRVMRVVAGTAVILCDDATGEWAARVIDAGKRAVTLAVTDQLRPREQVPDFWLCPALLKKDRFDLVLEKATELGVRAVHPVVTRRCVADKLNLERAARIVTEAAEQCARTALPELAGPVGLGALLAHWPTERTLFFADELETSAGVVANPETAPEPGLQITAADRAGAAAAFAAHPGPAALLIGPEGGFDDAERAAVRALPQARAIALGPRILRGETAAIAATALWMGIAGDWSEVRSGDPSGTKPGSQFGD